MIAGWGDRVFLIIELAIACALWYWVFIGFK